jgi:hypothetical protein
VHLVEKGPSRRGALPFTRPDVTEWNFSSPEPLSQEADSEKLQEESLAPAPAVVPGMLGAGETPAVPTARGIFRSWERLRLLYNVLVGFAVLLFVQAGVVQLAGDFTFSLSLLASLVAVNVSYLTGPTVEFYLSWVGVRRRSLRSVLFTVQSLAGAVLTALFL